MPETHELDSLSSELDTFASEEADLFAFEGLADVDASADPFEAELFDAGLDELDLGETEEAEPVSVAGLLGDEQVEELGFLKFFVKRKVVKLLRKLISLARRFPRLRRCPKCVRRLMKTIRCAKKGRWICALRQAYKTFRCFRRCARAAS